VKVENILGGQQDNKEEKTKDKVNFPTTTTFTTTTIILTHVKTNKFPSRFQSTKKLPWKK